MKKIDKYTIKGIIGPYILSFFVAEFVLVMQFLWKYIDDILGKGFSLSVLLELIFYFSITIVPMSIPLTILISSVMVFGNMGERYELSSMKSAGVSLIRIMYGAILIAILTACLSFISSNYLKPAAYKKFYQRLYSIKKQKATLNLEEGIFNYDFKNFVIRIGEKGEDNVTVKDILMYDHTQMDKGFISVISASHGKMYSSTEGNYFVMELEDGHQYRDIKKSAIAKSKEKDDKQTFPFMRTEFDTWSKVFDMAEFDLKAGDVNLTRKQYDLMNFFQLSNAIDSLDNKILESADKPKHNFGGIVTLQKNIQKEERKKASDAENDKVKPMSTFQKLDKTISESKERNLNSKQKENILAQIIEKDISEYNSIVELYEIKKATGFKKSALVSAKKVKDKLKASKVESGSLVKSQEKFKLRLHQQFSWAIVCIVFLFIGGPMGSIVKKGGYGYPLLVAIIFFMLFVTLNITGEKLLKTQSIDATMAAWLPILVLLPAAIYLTLMAINDATFGSLVNYFKAFFTRVKS